jgi:hypothetical protein
MLLVEVNVLRSVPGIVLKHDQRIFLVGKNQEQLVKLALLWTVS